MDLRWAPEEDIAMSVDCGEEEWSRLHDMRLNGQLLEYVGRGKSLIDVGLAQVETRCCNSSTVHDLIIGGALWRCHAQETQKNLTTFKGGAAVHFSEEPKKRF